MGSHFQWRRTVNCPEAILYYSHAYENKIALQYFFRSLSARKQCDVLVMATDLSCYVISGEVRLRNKWHHDLIWVMSAGDAASRLPPCTDCSGVVSTKYLGALLSWVFCNSSESLMLSICFKVLMLDSRWKIHWQMMDLEDGATRQRSCLFLPQPFVPLQSYKPSY